jgi:hypothetical protein
VVVVVGVIVLCSGGGRSLVGVVLVGDGYRFG